MDSPAITLQHVSHVVDPQRHHHYHHTNAPTSLFQPPLLHHHQPQSHFHYTSDYGIDETRFYPHQQQAQPPQHPYHSYLATPSSSTVDDTIASGGGVSNNSPFDDENQLPTPEEFRAIVDDYLNNLSPKKRDKALVDQHRYYLIQQVLRDPRNTAISTAQFRFWVKKMFQLQTGTLDVICHDNKPVAVKEQIYDILVRAHREAHHGGRDKTSALVRRKFSWIPKELVARFVRHCPFCITRRNGGQSPNPMKINSPQSYPYSTSATPVIMTATTPSQGNVTHLPNLDHGSSIMCTPTFKEESDVSTSSGPPSAENGYENSPHYVAMPYNATSDSSRRSSYFHYDREEDDFLNSYSYDPHANFQPTSSLATMMGFRSASSSTTTNTTSSQQNNNNSNASSLLPPPASSASSISSQQPYHHQQTNVLHHATPNQRHSSPTLFYHQQNYMYASYPNSSYYPSMLGITTCGGGEGNHPDRQPTAPFSPPPPQPSSSSSSSTQPHAVSVALLDHQGETQPPYFNATNHLVNYALSNPDPAVVAFGSSDL